MNEMLKDANRAVDHERPKEQGNEKTKGKENPEWEVHPSKNGERFYRSASLVAATRLDVVRWQLASADD